MRKQYQFAPLTQIPQTAARLGVLDTRNFMRPVDLVLAARNLSGTNPVLAAKLQGSDVEAVGPAYAVAGATDNTINAGASTTVQQGAQFLMVGAKSISSLALQLKKIGAIAAGQKLTVSIYTNSSSLPGTIIGTSALIDIDSQVGAAYGAVTATFPTPIDLADATLYWVVVAASYTASAVNAVQWRSNTLASGGNQATFNATIWAAVATQSLEFALNTLTFTDIVNGAFVAQAAAQPGQTLPNFVQTLFFDSTQLPAFVSLMLTPGGTTPVYAVSGSATAESRVN